MTMANPHGSFLWYELMTSDRAAAARFYQAVVGWEVKTFPGGGHDYQLFSRDGVETGGLMDLPAEACDRARPGWMGYIAVDSVDRTAAAAEAAGGAVAIPPSDIPEVGRFAVLQDPQGGVFAVMRGAMEGESRAFAQDRLGHCHWNELNSTGPEAALDFYLPLFGWDRGDAMTMEGCGTYQFLDQGGRSFGAVMPQQQPGAPSAWLFYFGVADIDRAAQAVTQSGGSVMVAPTEVPGGLFVLVAADPQGAVFGLVGRRSA